MYMYIYIYILEFPVGISNMYISRHARLYIRNNIDEQDTNNGLIMTKKTYVYIYIYTYIYIYIYCTYHSVRVFIFEDNIDEQDTNN